MENPASHGEAEYIVRRILDAWWLNQEKDNPVIGLSIERQITDALREAGILKE